MQSTTSKAMPPIYKIRYAHEIWNIIVDELDTIDAVTLITLLDIPTTNREWRKYSKIWRGIFLSLDAVTKLQKMGCMVMLVGPGLQEIEQIVYDPLSNVRTTSAYSSIWILVGISIWKYCNEWSYRFLEEIKATINELRKDITYRARYRTVDDPELQSPISPCHISIVTDAVVYGHELLSLGMTAKYQGRLLKSNRAPQSAQTYCTFPILRVGLEEERIGHVQFPVCVKNSFMGIIRTREGIGMEQEYVYSNNCFCDQATM